MELTRFKKMYKVTATEANDDKHTILPVADLLNQTPYEAFVHQFAGVSFNGGVYRVHQLKNLAKWNHQIRTAFPEFSKRIWCFGYDWLGRHFALDTGRLEQGKPQVLLLEPGTGEGLEIPSDLAGFHENILIDMPDAALAIEGFKKWSNSGAHVLKHHECVGYKVPLFLGGQDTPDNFEVSDMEVYWSICSQLLRKTKDLPAGTSIGSIKIN